MVSETDHSKEVDKTSSDEIYYKTLASEMLGAILKHGDLSKFGTHNCERWTKMLSGKKL